MQGIYTYIPETIYVLREYSVAAILLLLFMVLISIVSLLNLLYFYISTFRSMCVQCPIWLFSVVPWLHVSWYVAHVFSEWLWNNPSRPYYYWYHFCFYIPHALYFYCKFFFSTSFLITFLSPEIATSINIHVPFSLSRIIKSGLLSGIVLLLLLLLLLLLYSNKISQARDVGISCRRGNPSYSAKINRLEMASPSLTSSVLYLEELQNEWLCVLEQTDIAGKMVLESLASVKI